MNRYLVATYINQSNAILGDVVKNSKARQVRGLLSAADRLAESALESYEDMRYLEASFKAKAAYKIVLESAKAIGVPLKPFRWYEAYGISPAALSPKRQNEYYEDAQRALKQRMAP
jgi:hypothetical protein